MRQLNLRVIKAYPLQLQFSPYSFSQNSPHLVQLLQPNVQHPQTQTLVLLVFFFLQNRRTRPPPPPPPPP
ncbi:hypothetical protein L6452_13020 [Arctium lappa]|uniref:Uncharacterized protein n=1 Tax=Arctium lappa TaxID=4217 RepID=A0ACB9CGZ8_ARCLA|nr:hypothetical protein L6452_13020 [Arctium lappa]